MPVFLDVIRLLAEDYERTMILLGLDSACGIRKAADLAQPHAPFHHPIA